MRLEETIEHVKERLPHMSKRMMSFALYNLVWEAWKGRAGILNPNWNVETVRHSIKGVPGYPSRSTLVRWLKRLKKIGLVLDYSPRRGYPIFYVEINPEWMPEESGWCNKCAVEANKGIALINQVVTSYDLGQVGRGSTQSRSGPAKLIKCWKCPECGHSWT